MAVAFSVLRFSAPPTGMFNKKTKIWPLFVPAHNVADMVWAKNLEKQKKSLIFLVLEEDNQPKKQLKLYDLF